jgi:hypothetical protein
LIVPQQSDYKTVEKNNKAINSFSFKRSDRNREFIEYDWLGDTPHY